jgi:hypothetical protein
LIINKLPKQIILSDTHLEKELFQQIKNREYFNKPIGGLWSSTYTPDNNYLSEWHKFCVEEYDSGITDNATIFEFKPKSRIYQIDCYNDLVHLFKIYKNKNSIEFASLHYLDFESIKKDFDVINLTDKGQWETRYTAEYNIYGWDIECSLIMNFDCICNCEYKKIELDKNIKIS